MNSTVLNKDMGFVAEGQEVAVKVEAFPFTDYGLVPGRLARISRDAVQDEQLGLVYTARVELDCGGDGGGDGGAGNSGDTILIFPVGACRSAKKDPEPSSG